MIDKEKNTEELFLLAEEKAKYFRAKQTNKNSKE
jgi:hypothetical protein